MITFLQQIQQVNGEAFSELIQYCGANILEDFSATG